MNKYTCNSCAINYNEICTAIGIGPPHDCPYNLGDFKWKTCTPSKPLNKKVEALCACEQPSIEVADNGREYCFNCVKPITAQDLT